MGRLIILLPRFSKKCALRPPSDGCHAATAANLNKARSETEETAVIFKTQYVLCEAQSEAEETV
jgi:hypothetical protein